MLSLQEEFCSLKRWKLFRGLNVQICLTLLNISAQWSLVVLLQTLLCLHFPEVQIELHHLYSAKVLTYSFLSNLNQKTWKSSIIQCSIFWRNILAILKLFFSFLSLTLCNLYVVYLFFSRVSCSHEYICKIWIYSIYTDMFEVVRKMSFFQSFLKIL